jgi:dihydrofolate synthase/folylpolyglutamate synthase
MAKTKVVRTKSSPPKSRRIRVYETKNSNGSIRTYDDALRFLFSVTDYERMSQTSYSRASFNLSRMNRILAELGNPHKELRCVHIAGTKGKGSTAGMVAAMLRGAGYKVGLYVSPHLMDIRERITINEELIPQAAMVSILSSLSRIVKRLSKDSPTFFELVTATAFKYFADNKVDYAVIEVGLGGRLDSTNVIKPEICAITSIGYDHVAQLGNTLSSIASEKAGIFKPGVLAIAAPQEVEALTALRQAAEKVGCTLRVVGQDIDYNCRFEAGPDGSPINRICMNTPFSKFEHVNVPAPGEHQAINCAVALGVIDGLRQAGHNIPEDLAVAGLTGLRLPGTMEMICDDPRIIIDKAHNGLSIQALMKALGQHISYDSMVVIFACCRDKDISRMLSALALGADKVIFTYNDSPRSADPYEMSEQYIEMTGKMAQVADSLDEAIRIAGSAITRGDLICITGSCYIIGRAKKMFIGRRKMSSHVHV